MRLIDADELCEYWLYNGLNERIYDTNDVLESIDEQPDVDPESLRPTAHWDIERTDFRDVILCWKCDKCGRLSGDDYPYCPHCGARMVNTDEKHCT